ncbi:hypothetical protein [Nonomuraea dietziae]|uniref:hypothetical protein n=1 Tax=Nonomuraea dietziae TaxID=65515 RepID=UPI0031E3C4E9
MAEDRQVSPWSDDGSQQRGWADQQAGLYLTPDQSLVDDDARSFNRGTALESDRSYRPAPKATLTWTPRRDLIWEPGSQQDLGRLATDDAIQAIMRVQSLVYDLPDSQGPVAGDPRTLGSRWHAADFATVTLDIDGDRRRLFDAKLRSVLNPASISVVSTSQPLRVSCGRCRPKQRNRSSAISTTWRRPRSKTSRSGPRTACRKRSTLPASRATCFGRM